MEDNQKIILASLIFFKLILIGIGLWSNRFAKKDESSFLIGGRSLGPWVAGLSYAATSSSAWVLLGFSGFVFSVGLSALWMLPGIWVGYIICKCHLPTGTKPFCNACPKFFVQYR